MGICGLTGIVAALPMGLEAWDILLSAGILVSVVLVVVVLFSRPGEIQVSAQREAALATGHTDRRTVFEQPLLRPIMWLLLAASHRLAATRVKGWLRRTLIAAGSPNYYTPEEYLAVALAAGLVLAGLLEVVHLLAYGQFSLTLFVFGVGAGVGLTFYNLHDKAAKRLREVSRRVPYALDLVALAMGAGATFTEAVRTVAREDSDDPFNVELRALLAEMDLGTTRRRALQNLSDRTPLDSLRTIIASVIQAEELGTPLGDVLHDQATLMRLRRSFAAENRAAVASVRIPIACLPLIFAVLLAIFGPAIIKAVRGGLL